MLLEVSGSPSALSCTVAAEDPSSATKIVIAAPGAISPSAHPPERQLIPPVSGGVWQITETSPSAPVTAEHSDENGEARRSADAGETETVLPAEAMSERLTTSIRVPDIPPATNRRGFINARSMTCWTGLLTLQLLHEIPLTPVAVTELTTAPVAAVATVAAIETLDCPVKPAAIVQTSTEPGVGDSELQTKPCPAVTLIADTEIGNTSLSVSVAVVGPPELSAEIVHEIGAPGLTVDPAAGEDDLLTTMSAGGVTGRLDTASQPVGLHWILSADKAAVLITEPEAPGETVASTV